MQGSQNSQPNKKPKHHEEKEQSWRTQNSEPHPFDGGKKKVLSITDAGTIEFHLQKTSARCLLRPYTKKLTRKKSQIQIELKL